MSGTGHRAMILAAGLGTRMRPLTLTRPKPLIEVAAQPLIEHSLDRLAEAGIERCVVNMHYLADQVEAWAGERTGLPEIVLSDERDALLDTGGGVVKALPLLGRDAFFVLNSDSFWTDAGSSNLVRMRQTWDASRMDCLLLLAPMASAVGFAGPGDFFLDDDGRLERRGQREAAPYAYAGCYLVAPALFEGAPTGAFSMNLLWDRALKARRLFGLALNGLWLHVGTPDAIGLAEAALGER